MPTAIVVGRKSYLIVALICTSIMANDDEHLFMCLLVICISFGGGDLSIQIPCLFFFLRFYLFCFRERGREGEREGEKHQCARGISVGCFLHAPKCGPSPQPTLPIFNWVIFLFIVEF